MCVSGGARKKPLHLTFRVREGTAWCSVAMAIADVFSKNGYTVPNKIAKILRIFDGLETLKSRWVISLH